MKANELRIGNLVYYRKEDYKVVLIAEDLIKIDIGYGAVQRFEKNPIISPNIDELKPIPLTEEWLLKFGFYKVNHIGGYSFYAHKKNNFDIYLDEKKIKWYGHITQCKFFVHSFQNLYYEIQNNELELKP